MAIAGQTLVHPGTGEQLTFVRTAADTDGELLEIDFVVQPGGAVAAPHIHPEQLERWEVHAGLLRIVCDGEERLLVPGESAEVPPGATHTWSAEGDEELHMTVTLEPALDTEGFFEDFFSLAAAGRVGPDGMPSLLRVAVMLTDHPDTVWLASPPPALQRALFAVLAPIGRALGHSREHAALAEASRREGTRVATPA